MRAAEGWERGRRWARAAGTTADRQQLMKCGKRSGAPCGQDLRAGLVHSTKGAKLVPACELPQHPDDRQSRHLEICPSEFSQRQLCAVRLPPPPASRLQDSCQRQHQNQLCSTVPASFSGGGSPHWAAMCPDFKACWHGVRLPIPAVTCPACRSEHASWSPGLLHHDAAQAHGDTPGQR